MQVNFCSPLFMKQTGPDVQMIFEEMIFEDSHDETIYHVVSAFEQKTYEINDYRVERRRDFMITIIYDAFNYTDGLLDYRIFHDNFKLIDKLAEGLYIILKQSLKECSGAFYADPTHCADEYLKKHCKVLFKRIMAESDFIEGV